MNEHKFSMDDPNLRHHVALDIQLADAEHKFQAFRSEVTKLTLRVCLSFIFGFVLWSSLYSRSSIIKSVIFSLFMIVAINIMPLWIVFSKLRELRILNKEMNSWRILTSDYKNKIEKQH